MWKCPKCGRSFSREGQGHYCGKIETVDQYIEEQDENEEAALDFEAFFDDAEGEEE